MTVKTILMDVDGTMTGCYPDREHHSAFYLLENLVMKQCGITREQASEEIRKCGDCETHCLSEFLPQLHISREEYFQVLCNDLKKCIFITEDTKRFFCFLKEKKIPLYTGTTNSEFMTRAKLAAGGVAADSEKCEWFAGYYSGCFFRDPRGKFSPDFYPQILKHGGFNPETTMMIGDEPERDMLPALRSGIKYGVTIDRTQKEPLVRKDGGYCVNSFDVLQENINLFNKTNS